MMELPAEKLMHVMMTKIMTVHFVIPNVEINTKVLVLFVGKNVLKVVGKMMVHSVENLEFVMKIKNEMEDFVIQNVEINTKVLDQCVGSHVMMVG
jgi:predicted transcriptional regulator